MSHLRGSTAPTDVRRLARVMDLERARSIVADPKSPRDLWTKAYVVVQGHNMRGGGEQMQDWYRAGAPATSPGDEETAVDPIDEEEA